MVMRCFKRVRKNGVAMTDVSEAAVALLARWSQAGPV